MKSKRIAIIGAGTAGLATASFLARQSHQVTLFERVEVLHPVGAGLLLQPSGLQVLRALGIHELAGGLGARVTGLVGKLPNGSAIVNSFYQDADPDYQGLGIHRATLCHVLVESLNDLSIDWKMGHQVVALESQTEGARVVFQKDATEHQHSEEYDLVLVCNGARSILRPRVWTELDKAYPWGAIWAIVPECGMLDRDVLHQFYDSTDTMMGILPTGSLPDQLENKSSSVFWSLPAVQINESEPKKNTQLLLNGTQKRWPNVFEWLSQLPDDTQWLGARYRDVVMRKFGQDSIGVLGDAAHAMSPQLGQGANMALLDAWAMSQAMSQSESLTEMWQKYHALREPSIRFYQRMSRLLTPFYQSHNTSLGGLRDVSFRWMYHIPWLRKQMALTVSGVKTGPFSQIDLDQMV